VVLMRQDPPFNLAYISTTHLLDRIPEKAVPETPVQFPPLGHAPLKERFQGPLKPI
jgi:hypothetical protein